LGTDRLELFEGQIQVGALDGVNVERVLFAIRFDDYVVVAGADDAPGEPAPRGARL